MLFNFCVPFVPRMGRQALQLELHLVVSSSLCGQIYRIKVPSNSIVRACFSFFFKVYKFFSADLTSETQPVLLPNSCLLLFHFGFYSKWSCKRHSNCFCWKALATSCAHGLTSNRRKARHLSSILHLPLLWAMLFAVTLQSPWIPGKTDDDIFMARAETTSMVDLPQDGPPASWQ
jgi:hypothetical protein